MSWWHVAAVANLATLVAYAAVGVAIAGHLLPEQRWRGSPLGVATAAIFLTSAVHYGWHPLHQLLPAQGIATAKLAFELEERDRGMTALDQTLTAARRIITDVLQAPGGVEMDAGDLRRGRPAGGNRA